MQKNGSRFTIRHICQLAVLIAIAVVVSRFGSITTPITRIGFTFVPIVLSAVLYGPVSTLVVYVVADLLGAFIFYGYALPGITISCAIRGFMFGVILFGFSKKGVIADKNDYSLKNAALWVRIVAAALFDTVIVGLCINSFWLGMSSAGLSFGEATWAAYTATFITRIPQTLVMVPVQIIIIPFIITLARRLRKANVA